MLKQKCLLLASGMKSAVFLLLYINKRGQCSFKIMMQEAVHPVVFVKILETIVIT